MGPKSIQDVLLVGLMQLEYRGYDSAGIAVLNNDEIELRKQVGKIKNLETYLEQYPASGSSGIAHTRWATNGEVNQVNAHPHANADNSIAIVHNGIIENYSALQKKLESKGYIFRSETDTEVIPHLIEEYQKSENLDFVSALKKL